MNVAPKAAFAEIRELYAKTQASIDEYHQNPFHDRRLGDKRADFAQRLRLGCHVTVYTERPQVKGGRVTRGFFIGARRCGEEPVEGGLCGHHAAEKERLS